MAQKMNNNKLNYVKDVTNNTINGIRIDIILRLIKVSETLMELVEESGLKEVIIKVKTEGMKN